MAYPTADDLANFLEAAGVETTAAQEASLARKVSAAIAAFEGAVRRKMEWTSVSEDAEEDYITRSFSPPDNSAGVIRFGQDLCAVNSVGYQPVGADLSTFTEGTDYLLGPENAPLDGRPWTYIEMARPFLTHPLNFGYRKAIKISGKWAYAEVIPADAFEAILQMAGLSVLGLTLSAGANAGIIEKQIEDFRVRYGSSSGSTQVKMWGESVGSAVRNYMRLV